MKGKYHVTIQNNRVHYEFEIRRNITIIRGDSATGKTTLYQMIDQVTRQGASAGIEIICDKTCRTLPVMDWKLVLSSLQEQIIFIDEDSAFIRTQEFAEAVRGSDNYYVLITREDLPNLPYAVNEIYGIHSVGKYHDLRRTYNEFYRLYGTPDEKRPVRPDELVTEDSNAGYEFFSAICGSRHMACKSAGGKSNLLGLLRKEIAVNTDKEEIVAVGDGAAIGPEMSDIYLLMQRGKNVHLFLPESFEWLILKSGIVAGNRVKDILDHPEDYADSSEYFSWEQFFTRMLVQETEGTYLQYSKTSLNSVYLHQKEAAAIMDQMKGIDFGKDE